MAYSDLDDVDYLVEDNAMDDFWLIIGDGWDPWQDHFEDDPDQ